MLTCEWWPIHLGESIVRMRHRNAGGVVHTADIVSQIEIFGQGQDCGIRFRTRAYHKLGGLASRK